jgi:hypothetical protein
MRLLGSVESSTDLSEPEMTQENGSPLNMRVQQRADTLD